MSEEVLVIGAGIAGLCTALALGPTGRRVTVLERDGLPPSGDANEAFDNWSRRGAGHLRHSHAFLARLAKIIKSDHPELHDDLLALGVREVNFDAMLSPSQKASYQPAAADADFTLLFSRRTTLELAIRRYVQRMANVTIKSDAMVRSLITEKDASGAIRVRGVVTDEGEMRADVVIDASGKNGSGIEQLIGEGACVAEEPESAGILYFTRHYRLKPGKSEPAREGNPPSSGDLGYLKFGVFPADNGCFSITLAVPEIEYEMRKAIMHPEIWDGVMANLPGTKVWTDGEIAEPTGKILGMGDLQSRWREMVADGKPVALGYFAVGDTLIRTNPLYGRGCSMAAVQAYILRDVLVSASDSTARALAYHQRLQAELKPYYTAMRKQDRAAIRRAEQTLTPSYKPGLRAKLMRSFAEDAVGPAMRFDINLLREAMRGFHMLEHPDAWLKRPANMIRILSYWARGKKANAAAYQPKPGPEREMMMRALGLSAEADIELLAQRRRDEALAKAA